MLAELAPNLTSYRYYFNNPINYTDSFGLWEKNKNGYTTDDNNVLKDLKRKYKKIYGSPFTLIRARSLAIIESSGKWPLGNTRQICKY